MSRYVDKSMYRAALDREAKLREQVDLLTRELHDERERKHNVLRTIIGGPRAGKTASTIEQCNLILDQVARLVPVLEENASTKSVARKLRTFLNMPPAPIVMPREAVWESRCISCGGVTRPSETSAVTCTCFVPPEPT